MSLPAQLITLTPNFSLPAEKLNWGGLYGSSQALAVVESSLQHDGLSIVVTPDTPSAYHFASQCRFFGAGHEQLPLLHFPDWETLPYDNFSPHQDIVSQRLLSLHRLPNFQRGILIIPIATLMQRLTPRRYLDANCFQYGLGDTLNLEQFRQRLVDAGYRAVSEVFEHGEFCIRGNLFDLFPMGGNVPYRIELFDDEIESIRSFDTESQRTIDKVERLSLLPAREFPMDENSIKHFRSAYRAAFEGDPQKSHLYTDVSNGIAPAGIEYYLPLFFENCDTLFEYLPNNCVIYQLDGCHGAAESFWDELNERYENYRHDTQKPILAPAKLFQDVPELFQQLKHFPRIFLQSFKHEEKPGYSNFPTAAPPNLSIEARAPEPSAKLVKFLNEFKGNVLFVAESLGRRENLLNLLNPLSIRPQQLKDWREFMQLQSRLGICVASIDEGLLLNDPQVAVICEHQLFGDQVLQRRRRRSKYREPDQIVKNLVELVEGSPVVHEEHGVGRYRGLIKLDVGELEQEFLTIEYAGEDKLYVPVSSLHLISRYTGASPENAPWHKLGSSHWEKVKRKARERVHDVAAQLLEIYSKREAKTGYGYTLDSEQYSKFAASFPFEETEDQEQAINAVLQDMQAAKPMDRLVCGDVGFGKTEVAMRAAFVAVEDNKQVAMLVPTTLLVQQHYNNFVDRFADWPIRIGAMSRFQSKSELNDILGDLKKGKIDIVIGTHKLLQSSVKYQNLGLVIIDEEHRFGVRQKETFKKIRSEVDVLTLTATPIPRTLNLSFSGLRDLSIIATPPAKRLAIRTFISEWNKLTIREACMREIHRGGQVFFLHNQVDNIDKIAADVRELIPEAKVEIAHGQMRERQLETVMADFYHQRFNILVCTTIIETGIDVPNANTIIMNRADRFGLAQLYQLRGRVGRSHHQAYAYLIVPNRKSMTADAIKRLEAIESIQELGTGFTLATHDLEIRGAGEILGDEQSGQMHEIGFNLYIDLLERAVADLKSGKKPELEMPMHSGTEVDLGVSAIIPDSYLPDVHTRLIMYKRISNATDVETLRELQVEMIDRFGLLPAQIKNLIAATEVRLCVQPFGVKKIEMHDNGGSILFNEQPEIDPMSIIELIQSKPAQYKLQGQNKLLIIKATEKLQNRVDEIKQLFTGFRLSESA